MWDYLVGIKEQTEERPNLILMFHSGPFRFMGTSTHSRRQQKFFPFVHCNKHSNISPDFTFFTLHTQPKWAQV